MSSFTNQAKTSTSVTNMPISGTLQTWDGDADTWASSVGTWDNPGAIIYSNVAKNTTAVTNQTRNT